MKVLMIGQLPLEVGGSYTDGVCNVVYELSKCSNSNIELFVYATNIKDDDAKKITGTTCYCGSIIRLNSIICHVLLHPIRTCRQWIFYKTRCKANPLRYDIYRDNIQRIINEVKPDIIHCMNIVQLAATHFANVTDIPIVLTFHGVNINSEAINTAPFPDYVSGLTQDTMSDIQKLGVPSCKCIMIPNGTDVTKFYYNDAERIKLRKEMGVDDDTTLLITVGSIQQRKGQYDFVHKLQCLPQFFEYKYLIIGEGPDKDKMVEYISSNGLSDKVKIIGYVSNTDLYKYYSAADIYIHSSYKEGQALSEVEAYTTDMKIAVNNMVAGTIVTDISNSDDYFVFEMHDFDTDRFVEWAMNHKKQRKTRELFDWNKIYDKYVDLYKMIKK